MQAFNNFFNFLSYLVFFPFVNALFILVSFPLPPFILSLASYFVSISLEVFFFSIKFESLFFSSRENSRGYSTHAFPLYLCLSFSLFSSLPQCLLPIYFSMSDKCVTQLFQWGRVTTRFQEWTDSQSKEYRGNSSAKVQGKTQFLFYNP